MRRLICFELETIPELFYRLLSEFLEAKTDFAHSPKLRRRAIVHDHCHKKAVLKKTDEGELLKRPGLDFEVLDSGCCGMAGSFDFVKEHYDVSLRIGELVLLPAIRKMPDDTLIIADGFSCREQIAQTTNRRALHSAEVIRMAINADERLKDQTWNRNYCMKEQRKPSPSSLTKAMKSRPGC